MSRNGITQDQVFDAAQHLTDLQQTVSVQAVRDQLGAGSFTTIAQHLRQWRSQANQTTSPPMPLPPEVELTASKAATLIWQVTQELARREIDAIRQASQHQIHEAQAQAQEALDEVARLETQAHGFDQQITEQAQQLEALRQALACSQADSAAHAARVEQLDERIQELKAELSEARAATEQKVEECGRLRGELAARIATPSAKKQRVAPPGSS